MVASRQAVWPSRSCVYTIIHSIFVLSGVSHHSLVYLTTISGSYSNAEQNPVSNACYILQKTSILLLEFLKNDRK